MNQRGVSERAQPTVGPPNRRRLERILFVIAVLSLVTLWWIGGALNRPRFDTLLTGVMPSADRFEPLAPDTFVAYRESQIIAYVAFGQAEGYGGQLRAVAVVSTSCEILKVAVVSHSETLPYMEKVRGTALIDQLKRRICNDEMRLGYTIDAVTGATYTARAIVSATERASHKIAESQLGLDVPRQRPAEIVFGIPAVTLVALFALGYLSQRSGFRFRRQARWVLLLSGMVVLGFWFNLPLTISRINLFLLGQFPSWRAELYWYLLIGGVLISAVVDNKNAYCAWFCPFGAVQECMAALGGGKLGAPRRARRALIWIQRGLAFAAIGLALVFRNPGISSYEVFSVAFNLTGSTLLFFLLALVLVLSLFINRPWCRFLCPLNPVYDGIVLIRQWIRELWQKTKSPSVD